MKVLIVYSNGATVVIDESCVSNLKRPDLAEVGRYSVDEISKAEHDTPVYAFLTGDKPIPGGPMLSSDPVNRPSHYTTGKIEVIDFIQDQLTPEEFAGFCKGNVLKYAARAGKKDPKLLGQDIAKGSWYANRLAQFVEQTINKNK